MARKPCCDHGEDLKRGAWTAEEDKKLIAYIQEQGEGCWNIVPKKAGLRRCGKSCRLRWTNYLRPDVKRGEFSLEEDKLIIKLHAARGNKWSVIAKYLPGRTDNEIKNYWNTHIKKRLIKSGIDPMTHKPIGSRAQNPNSKNTRDPEQESLPKPSRWSASLLNKMASKFSQAASYNALSELLEARNIESPCDSSENQRSVPRCSPTSSLLNKMATRANAMNGLFLSASVEGCRSTPTPTSSHNSETNLTLVGMEDMVSPSHYLENHMPHCEDNLQGVINGTNGIPVEIEDQQFEFSECLDACRNEIYDKNIDNNEYDMTNDILSLDVLSTSVDEGIFAMEGWSELLLDQPNESMDISFTSEEGFYGNEWSNTWFYSDDQLF